MMEAVFYTSWWMIWWFRNSKIFKEKAPKKACFFEELQSKSFMCEKVNEARHKYSTYEQESYAIVRIVEYWRHYLLPNEFIVFSDHEALKFINEQHSLKPRHAKWVETLQAYSKPRHAKWVETLQAYSFVIWHKAVSANIVVDVLARRIVLLSAMNIQKCCSHLCSTETPKRLPFPFGNAVGTDMPPKLFLAVSQ
nr:putative mitochondrial protein [Tanacetum cinerariifolium]